MPNETSVSTPKFGELCDHCKAQNDFPYGNFDHLASRELPRSHAVTLHFGTINEILSRQGQCAFCSLVISAISTAWSQSPPPVQVGDAPIVCRLRNRVVGVIRELDSETTYHENFQANKYRYSSCRLIIECKPSPPGCHSDIEIQAIDSGSDIKGLFDDAPLFTRRPCADMETVNFALLKQWLSHCENSHAALCRPDPVSNTAADAYLQAFRLIDVTKRKIVLAQPDDEYVALSYVWGRDPFLRLLRSNESDLFLDGSLGRDNNPVPKTISHALEAVSRLGMRYLWVDALCIMQDNHAEKATAISAMDLIYARAALTIVAASGTHANAGLAGLEPHTRDPMPYEARARFPESRHEFVVARASPPDLLRRSAWNTRGWTYQERLCSHRLLVFADQQVVYLCGVAAWCEDTVLETGDGHVHYEAQPLYSLNMANDETSSFMRQVDGARRRETSLFHEYAKMVDEYTSRNLTFPGDILDAFTGGLTRFEQNCKRREGIELESLFGLPAAWLELGLLWNQAAGSRAWKRRGLKWRHPSGVEVAFPSWSWMGWMGPTDAQVLEPPTRPEIDWYYAEPGAGRSEIRRLVTRVSQPMPAWFQTSDAPRALREKWKPDGAAAVVSQADVGHLSPDELAGKLLFYTSSQFLTLTNRDDFLNQRGNRFSIGANDGEVNLDPEWANGCVGRKCEFIVLARYMANDWERPGLQDMLWVMLVERRGGGIAYRVGVGHVAESAWVAGNPSWQLVVLG